MNRVICAGPHRYMEVCVTTTRPDDPGETYAYCADCGQPRDLPSTPFAQWIATSGMWFKPNSVYIGGLDVVPRP